MLEGKDFVTSVLGLGLGLKSLLTSLTHIQLVTGYTISSANAVAVKCISLIPGAIRSTPAAQELKLMSFKN